MQREMEMINNILYKITLHANRVLIFIAGIFLVTMIVLTCANIFFRAVWIPVQGTFELMGFFGALVTSFSLGYTQLNRGHIAVDILVRKFPPKITKLLTGISDIACMAFFALISWQLAEKGTILLKSGELTETLRIIYYPFTYGTAAGCAFLTFVFLTDLIRTLIAKKEKKS